MVVSAPVPLPRDKFVLVATAGVAACFMTGHALTRVPGTAKVKRHKTGRRPEVASREHQLIREHGICDLT